MRRATGPGQVEVTPSIPTCRARSIRALLFNFDIDDATVKPEHQQWLEQNLVPLLAIRGARLGLRGTASRTGTDVYNQRLSERRVTAVLDFLLARGAQRSQIDPTAVGEDDARRAGERDGTEDSRFRAVVVALHVPLSSLPVRFDRLDPTDRKYGFDDSVSPPWLLIPYELPFDVVRIVNGEGTTLISTNPAVARPVDPANPGRPFGFVTENPDFVRIEAGLPGDAEIQALDACGNVVARLSISVLEKVTVRTAFHYVQNRGVGTRTRRLGDEVAFLQTMNDIYLPQANIEFVTIQAHDLPIADNLGNEVNTIGN